MVETVGDDIKQPEIKFNKIDDDFLPELLQKQLIRSLKK